MSKRVGIIDYGLGNIYSVNKACQKSGFDTVITSNKATLEDVDALILPGVGAFGNAMQSLRELDLIETILNQAKVGKPLLGICLGMQLLMKLSNEFGEHSGLGLIDGEVVKFPEGDSRNFKIPQIQWNNITINQENSKLLEGIPQDTFYYFLHSYYVKTQRSEVVAATVDYKNINYCCAVEKDNIFGTQFHPEKSSKQGLKIFQNFKNFINNGK